MFKLKIIVISFLLIFLFAGCFQETTAKKYKNVISEMEFENLFGNYEKNIGKFINNLEKLDGKMEYSLKELNYNRELGKEKLLIGKNKNLELRIKFYENNDTIYVYCDNDNVNVIFSKKWADEIGWYSQIPMGIYQFELFSHEILKLKNKGKLK